MTRTTYREMGKTPSGRKEAHDMMLEDVKTRMDRLLSRATTAANKEKVSKIFNLGFEKISALGNGNLFDFFANDELSDISFCGYVQDVIKGNIW